VKALLTKFRSLVAGRMGAVRGDADEVLASAHRKIAEKNQKLKKLRERLEKKDQELTELRNELAWVRNTEGLPGFSGGDMPVFFIVGFAKSGTSWLTKTLNGHPEILCMGEGLLFGRGTDLDKRRGTLAPSSLYGVFADSDYLRAWLKNSIWTRGEDEERHILNLTHMSVDYFLGEKLAKTGKRIVGDKTPFITEQCIEEIAAIYPEARVIHIIRDGRDVAVSAVHHTWNYAVDAGGHLTVSPEELATRDAYRKDPQAFLASGKSIFDEGRLRRGFAKPWYELTTSAVRDGPALLKDNYTEVRYEDLLGRPEEEVGRLLRFLGADASEEVLGRCVRSASFESRTRGRERGQEDSTAFLRKGVAGDWRNVFTERDKEIFKEVAGNLLIELRYEKDHNW